MAGTVLVAKAGEEDEQAVRAILDALYAAIAASPIAAAIFRRDGEQVGAVVFSGDDYIFETPRRTTYPTSLRTVARRLVREGFTPEQIAAVVEPAQPQDGQPEGAPA